jgi:uncharacterized membrane protein
MKMASIVGVLLIVLGIVSLVFQGIPYTTQRNVVNLGPILATEEVRKQIPLPPVLGGIALVGGITLVVVGSKKKP